MSVWKKTAAAIAIGSGATAVMDIAGKAVTQARRPHDPHFHPSSMSTLPEHRGRGA